MVRGGRHGGYLLYATHTLMARALVKSRGAGMGNTKASRCGEVFVEAAYRVTHKKITSRIAHV